MPLLRLCATASGLQVYKFHTFHQFKALAQDRCGYCRYERVHAAHNQKFAKGAGQPFYLQVFTEGCILGERNIHYWLQYAPRGR